MVCNPGAERVDDEAERRAPNEQCFIEQVAQECEPIPGRDVNRETLVGQGRQVMWSR
jgi:hypothetical protein